MRYTLSMLLIGGNSDKSVKQSALVIMCFLSILLAIPTNITCFVSTWEVIVQPSLTLLTRYLLSHFPFYCFQAKVE